MFFKCRAIFATTTRRWLIGIIATVLMIGVCVGLVILFSSPNDNDDDHESYTSLLGQGAIASPGIECADIGKEIFAKNGSVADVAIAVLLCGGVSSPQSHGIGGGFVATIYIKETGVIDILNARERAPKASTADMFVDEPSKANSGGLAVAVPGELKGYWDLHQKYGKLKWSELFEPTIRLCREGHIVSKFLAEVLLIRREYILKSESFTNAYVNSATGDLYKEGDKIVLPDLAETLTTIANEGPNALYEGSLTSDFVRDIAEVGGIITADDLKSYSAKWDKPVVTQFQDTYHVYSAPLPFSGTVLILIINILNQFLEFKSSVLNYHRITEAFKYAYAKRTELADPVYEPSSQKVADDLIDPDYAAEIRNLIQDTRTFQDYEHYGANFSSFNDGGTSHISIILPNGDAIAITSTINSYFGCKERTSSGIILNNLMDDFSTPGLINDFGIPPSPANFIKPGKQPMSSMTPTILINNYDEVEMVIGGAGGSKITTMVAYVMIRHFLYGETIEDAIAARRIHHQLAPMVLNYEYGFDDDVVKELMRLGHVMEVLPNDSGFAALTAISREGNKYSSVVDSRRGGSIAYIDKIN